MTFEIYQLCFHSLKVRSESSYSNLIGLSTNIFIFLLNILLKQSVLKIYSGHDNYYNHLQNNITV